MFCKNSNDYKRSDIPNTQKAQLSILSPKDEKDFIVRKAFIKQGGSMPKHINKIQHQQYVLSGEAKVVVGDQVYHAKAHDFIYIPAGAVHYYEACYESDYEFLCMITTQEDIITLID